MNSRRPSLLPAKTFINLPSIYVSFQKLVQIADTQVWRPLFSRTVMFFSCLTCFLYIIPYAGRGLLTLPVITSRNERATGHSAYLWASFLSAESDAELRTQQRPIKSGTRHLYSAGDLNCMYLEKESHRTLDSLYQRPYFPIRTWVSEAHTNGETAQ